MLEEEECGYLVMEYIAGESLAACLARTRRPEIPFVLRILREMASALDYTHGRGVIHRDIKPANVMIDTSGAAKIMDFGIARITDTRTNTPSGMVMGTLEYMAPEQIKGEAVDGRADQFSLAAVAYEMLTGTTLFGEASFATLAYKLVNEMPPSLRTHNPELLPAVDEVVGRALRKSPSERFATCGDFITALDGAFQGIVPITAQQTEAIFRSHTAETVDLSPPTVATRVSVPPDGVSVPARQSLFSKHDEALGHYRRYSPAQLRRVVAANGLVVQKAGGLFHSLLFPRTWSVVREKFLRLLAREPPLPPAADDWNASAWVSKGVERLLAADNALSHACSELGWDLPGLSIWVVCQRARPE